MSVWDSKGDSPTKNLSRGYELKKEAIHRSKTGSALKATAFEARFYTSYQEEEKTSIRSKH